ncbi:pyroglutamyl-peptidase I [Lichenihabitans psoromatis]|uniref:pyroglutamyl-peptidase I family protein n=1 Tax=Lichenihabitans psoromatis TaxID=2528642 RepID=UPI001038310A|nr:pyroglutamyl-peptidase I [Lichenihabitans psoromatis]
MNHTLKIVVTGFEPFAHGTENPTLDVLAELRAANDIEGDLIAIQMPVDSGKLAALTSATLDDHKPDLWISLGVAPGLSVIAVERIAANVMDFPIADNVGTQHGGHPVFEGGPAGHLATLPVKTIADQLRASGIPAKVSNSPSTYLCNQMMYTVLHLIAEKGMATRAGFIHVPAHPSFVAKQVYPFVEMPSMSIDLMTSAVKHAIRTAATVEQDHRRPGFNY